MPDSDASPQPDLELDAEAKELQLAKFKAEARKAIAEAHSGTVNAGLYEPKSQPIKGETTLGEKSGSLLTIIGLRALDELAKAIAKDVSAHLGDAPSVLIVESRALAVTDAPRAEISERFVWFKHQ